MKTQSSRGSGTPDAATFSRAILFALGLIAATQCALAQYTPTISGVSAFWFLGSGILADGGMCSTGQTGPCYYAQSQLSSNANGAPVVPLGPSSKTGKDR
jgi:hypothetical protein